MKKLDVVVVVYCSKEVWWSTLVRWCAGLYSTLVRRCGGLLKEVWWSSKLVCWFIRRYGSV